VLNFFSDFKALSTLIKSRFVHPQDALLTITPVNNQSLELDDEYFLDDSFSTQFFPINNGSHGILQTLKRNNTLEAYLQRNLEFQPSQSSNEETSSRKSNNDIFPALLHTVYILLQV
jgi:hypothetical protein